MASRATAASIAARTARSEPASPMSSIASDDESLAVIEEDRQSLEGLDGQPFGVRLGMLEKVIVFGATARVRAQDPPARRGAGLLQPVLQGCGCRRHAVPVL